MFNKKFLPLLFLSLVIACVDDVPIDKPISTSINKIMPLGASRVEGARPDYESFRYELWKDLIDGGWTFDFVGTMTDDADYPNFNAKEFDADHEGRGGWTSGQILDGINNWFTLTGGADIVLFSSPGGNDALQGLPYDVAVSNINNIIDLIQFAHPGVTIIIEQLAPARSDAMTPDLSNYFDKMLIEVGEIAEAQTTSTSKVIAVDMSTDFLDEFYADDVHYNEAGAAVIAERYYEVLVDVLQQ